MALFRSMAGRWGPLRTCASANTSSHGLAPASATTAKSTSSRSRNPLGRRYAQTRSQFEPLRPPSPESLGAPQTARDFGRSRKWLGRMLALGAVGGTIYLVDRQVYASGLGRSLRTFGNGIYVALDYKLNFRPEPLLGGSIEDLHRRSAERLFELLRVNGGLYLKIGQAIAMQSAVLPPEFQKMFSRMFDDAPQVDWPDVEKVIRKDYHGKNAEEVFGVSFTGEDGKGLMERRACASASVAQVHWARLPDGREVAVKIQKPEIAKQIGWDLWAFKVVMNVYSRWFDLPFTSIVGYVTERLQLETDFEAEAKNSETMRSLVNSEPTLRGRVYVPVVYPEFTTKRILVTEWIEGVRLWDKAAMTGRWIGGYGKGSPGVHGAQLEPPNMATVRQQLRQSSVTAKLKPEREPWRGRNGKGGLGLTGKEVMSTIIDLFSAQIFKWGVVVSSRGPIITFAWKTSSLALPNGSGRLGSLRRFSTDSSCSTVTPILVICSFDASPQARLRWSSSTTASIFT